MNIPTSRLCKDLTRDQKPHRRSRAAEWRKQAGKQHYFYGTPPVVCAAAD
jgi:hypothetical protein